MNLGVFNLLQFFWIVRERCCAGEYAKLLQSCPTICNPMDWNPSGSSVHRILQARIVEWVAMLFSRRSFQPKDRTHISSVSCIGRQVLYHWCHLGSSSFWCTTRWISSMYTYIPSLLRFPPTPALSHASRSSQSARLCSQCYIAASH